jgi:hypothetical protein
LYGQGIYAVETTIAAGSSGSNRVAEWTAGKPDWTPIEGTVGEMTPGGLVHIAVPAGGDSPAGTWTVVLYLKNPANLNEAYSFLTMEVHARVPAAGAFAEAPADWAVSTGYTVGLLVKPTAANGHYYRCTTAGTSAGTEPTWPLVSGATVADGTAVWTEFGPDTRRAPLAENWSLTSALTTELYDLLNPDKGYVIYTLTSSEGSPGIVETVDSVRTVKVVETAAKATHRVFALGIASGAFFTKNVSVPANLSPSFYVEVRGR